MSDVQNKNPIWLIEEYKGTLQILIQLLKLDGESYITQLVGLINLNNKTIRNARGNMISAGLITLDERLNPQDKKYRLYMILTDKGKRVAKLAAEIEDELRKE